MQQVTISVLGFSPTITVPSTPEEYNALAPKRANACVEDANNNTIYRGVSPVIRDGICAMLEAAGVARKNFGTDDEPQWEKEGVFKKRAIAELASQRGTDEAAVMASFNDAVQAIADSKEARFDPSERETKGPAAAFGKGDLKLAEQVIADGKVYVIAAKLSAILNRPVATDDKSLARAIADNRRALAEKAAQEQKLALGL